MNKLYVFIDESGDPGNTLSLGGSSPHYAELALQIDGNRLKDFLQLILNWKYCTNCYGERKTLPSKAKILNKYITPFKALHDTGNLLCSCVYLFKSKYIGPHFSQNITTKHDPIKFRNFVHRQLLEFHFGIYHPPPDSQIELVFDKYVMNLKSRRNLEDYLQQNYNLPDFEHITHVDSEYVDAMQFTSQLVSAIKSIISHPISSLIADSLDFIELKDISNPYP